MKDIPPMSYAARGLAVPPRRDAAPQVTRDPGDASVGTGNFTQGVPAFWFARSLDYGAAEQLYTPYADSVWVQRAIKKISHPIASVPVEFSVVGQLKPRKTRCQRGLWTARGVMGRKDEALLDLPSVQAWMREPMRGLSWADFVEASVGWLKMAECFWLLTDDAMLPFPDQRRGNLPQVIVARPDRMRPVLENGQILGWSFIDGAGKSWNLLADQVIQLRYWNPYNDQRGIGEYRSAHLAAEGDWLAGKFSRNLMANNGDTGPFVVAKNGVPTDAQREQIVMDLRAKRQAHLRGEFRPIFMTGDITVEDPAVKAVDAPFITQRLENRHEIALAFGVPPSMFDVKAAYSIGSASDYFQLVFDACMPTGSKLCGALDRLLSKLTGKAIESGLDWDEHPVLQEVRRERLDSMSKLADRGMPLKQISDYLGLDLPKFEGWDVGLVPISVTPLEQAMEPPAENPDLAEPTEGNEGNEEQPEPVKALLAMLWSGTAPATRASEKNKRIWEAHMRLRSKAVKAYQTRTSKIINDYRVTALRKLGAMKALEIRSLLDVIFDRNGFCADLLRGLHPVAQNVLASAASELLSEIGRADDPWKLPHQDVLDFIAGRERSIAGVADTCRDQLNTTISDAVEDGKGIEEMTSDIKATFNNLSRYEAKRVAMTESGCAYGFARDRAMKAAGIEYKTWLSSHGPTVRQAHADAELKYGNDPIPVDEPFMVGGEGLMYPGDPSGSPANIINCQCVSLAAQAPEED